MDVKANLKAMNCIWKMATILKLNVRSLEYYVENSVD